MLATSTLTSPGFLLSSQALPPRSVHVAEVTSQLNQDSVHGMDWLKWCTSCFCLHRIFFFFFFFFDHVRTDWGERRSLLRGVRTSSVTKASDFREVYITSQHRLSNWRSGLTWSSSSGVHHSRRTFKTTFFWTVISSLYWKVFGLRHPPTLVWCWSTVGLSLSDIQAQLTAKLNDDNWASEDGWKHGWMDVWMKGGKEGSAPACCPPA